MASDHMEAKQRKPRSGRRFSVGPALALLPFFGFAFVFLIVPTLTVIVGAFQVDGAFSFENLGFLRTAAARDALVGSLIVSGASALIGASVGALLSYIVASLPPSNVVRKTIVALSGVLAQFGGVTLSFAFIATYSFSGVITLALQDTLGWNIYGNGWLYDLPGLTLVYTYFQIPLMVIVFLPAIEGLRPQWREAAVNLGATSRQYWTQVAIPLLRPAFLGSLLLLFANAFAAYATAAALTAFPLLVPLQIRSAFSSEVSLGNFGQAYALALEMIVVVAVVMAAYAVLLRRTSRWLQ